MTKRFIKITLSRWPWQGYGWNPFDSPKLFGRFGGGWNIKAGIQMGTRTIIIDAILGSIRIELKKREPKEVKT